MILCCNKLEAIICNYGLIKIVRAFFLIHAGRCNIVTIKGPIIQWV